MAKSIKPVEGQLSLNLEKDMVLSRDIKGNKQVKRLIALYKEAEKEIAQKLLTMDSKTATARLLKTQKKAIDGILKELRRKGATIAEAMTEAAYRGGFQSGRAELVKAGIVEANAQAELSTIHRKAMEIYSSQVLSRLSDVETTAGRTVQDIYNALQLNTVMAGAAAGTETITAAQRKMQKIAESGGLTSFIDKKGRAWSMSSYVEMLSRTTLMQVHNKAKEIEFLEHGEDLVIISSHPKACELCVPWQGKVLSLSGKNKDYPSMQEAVNAGLFHPNCRHSFSLYIDDSQYGALSDKNDPNYTRREAHADRYYEEIKKRGIDHFSSRISHNTGFSKRFIEEIYKHVFENNHVFENRVGLFNSSYDMSVSFQRLIQGNYLPHDIILLRHEHLERCLEKRYNLVYQEAHNLTEKKYNYAKALKEARKNGLV